MKIGFLHYDADPKTTLAQKVSACAAHYRAKYGVAPNLCFVNPRQLGDYGPLTVGDVMVRSERTVLPNHFWIGVGDKCEGNCGIICNGDLCK